MSLSQYKPETRTVVLSEASSVHLHGLGLVGISVLVREHFPDLDALIALFQRDESIAAGDMKGIALSLTTHAPGLVANVIAIAADEPDQAPVVMTMPAPLQIKLLTDILELTFTEVGGIKKAWGMFADLLGMAKMMAPQAAAKVLTKTRKRKAA